MIVYKSGTPPGEGVYAGRVMIAGIESDQFIEFVGGEWRWSRNGALIARNGEVLGHVGPLQRNLGEPPAGASLIISPTELDEMIREFTRRAMLAAFEKAGWDENLTLDSDVEELAGFAIRIMEFGLEDR